MSKSDHLEAAKLFFGFLELAESNKRYSNMRLWETYMYESLFAWAGWKE